MRELAREMLLVVARDEAPSAPTNAAEGVFWSPTFRVACDDRWQGGIRREVLPLLEELSLSESTRSNCRLF